jgi:hypothetical protein
MLFPSSERPRITTTQNTRKNYFFMF